MKITRRLVGALMAAVLGFGVVGFTTSSAQADTSWGQGVQRR